MSRKLISCLVILLLATVTHGFTQELKPAFKVVAIAEGGDRHQPYVDAAVKWLNEQAKIHNFKIDYIENADPINEHFLSGYQLFIQLNFLPYRHDPGLFENTDHKKMFSNAIFWAADK